jgi:Tfp pilus assembly protein PilN
MALREINLLDPDWVRRRALIRHLCFWGVCLIAGLMLISAVHFQGRAVLAKKKAGMLLGSTQTQLAVAGDEFKRLQAELDVLNQQHGAIKAIIRGPAYSRILVVLSDRMNASTWLTQLQVDSGKFEDPNVQVMLTGLSCSHEALGDFLNRLAADRFFLAVQLKYTREMEAQPGQSPCGTPSLIQFQITSQVPKG